VSAEPAVEPIWTPPAPRGGGGELPRRCDVVVVGGGITGVALLHALSRRGVRALLLERDHLAAGASGRNAGFLLMGVAANYATAVRTYGRDVAREVWHFTAQNHELLAEILDGRAQHARRGSMTLAATRDEAALLRESEALLGEDGLPGRWVDAGAAPPLGGLVNDADGEVDPAAAVGAIAAACAAAAELREGVAVERLESSGGSVRVHLAGGGEVEAGAVLLATNAYTPELVETVRIAAVRAQMLATAPSPHHVAERPTYSNFGYRYWRQRDDGRVLLGGWRDTAVEEEVGTEAAPTARVQEHLDGHLREMGVSAPVTHRWAGIMGFTADELPLVGAVEGMPGVYVCGGYTGHGMGFAVNAARLLVDHVLDGAAIPAWLRADRPVAVARH